MNFSSFCFSSERGKILFNDMNILLFDQVFSWLVSFSSSVQTSGEREVQLAYHACQLKKNVTEFCLKSSDSKSCFMT